MFVTVMHGLVDKALANVGVLRFLPSSSNMVIPLDSCWLISIDRHVVEWLATGLFF